jgi:hypothetical protein
VLSRFAASPARTRIEARMVVDAEDLAWRLRQLVRAKMPLNDDQGPVLVVWSEAF